jgi:hypothetical protein
MKKKSMTKNHGGGIIGGAIVGGAIIEKRSLRRNHWKEYHRRQLIEERGIWEASGRHLGGIWDCRRTWGTRRLRITKNDAPLS